MSATIAELPFTRHAVEQFAKRVLNHTEITHDAYRSACRTMKKMLWSAEPIALSPYEEVRRMANNDWQKAEYLCYTPQGVVFVKTGNRIVTCYIKKMRDVYDPSIYGVLT